MARTASGDTSHFFEVILENSLRRWSRHYAVCLGCGRTTVKHRGHGLCKTCYNKSRPEEVARHVAKSYEKRFGGNRAKHFLLHPACRKCGTLKDILIHHVDGDRKNNLPSNFATLCRKCHSSLHNYIKLEQKWSPDLDLTGGLQKKRLALILGLAKTA